MSPADFLSELAKKPLTFSQRFRSSVLRRKAVIPDKQQMRVCGRPKRFADVEEAKIIREMI